MQRVEDLDVHEPVPGGVGAHLHLPIPEFAHCRVNDPTGFDAETQQPLQLDPRAAM
jgi:hypothetical protein